MIQKACFFLFMLLGLNIFFAKPAHNTSYNTENLELTTHKIYCVNGQT